MDTQRATYDDLSLEIYQLEKQYNELDSLLYYHMDDYNLIATIVDSLSGEYVDLIRVSKMSIPPFSEKSANELIAKMQNKKAEYQKMIPFYAGALKEWAARNADAREKLYNSGEPDKIKQYEEHHNKLHTTYYNQDGKIKTFNDILANYKLFSIGGQNSYYYKYLDCKAKYQSLETNF